MGYFSDSDSEDLSVSSGGGSECMATPPPALKRKPSVPLKVRVGSSTASHSCRSLSPTPTRPVTEGSNEERLASILALGLEMEIDRDAEFSKAQARNTSMRKQQLSGIAAEERLQQESRSVSELMSKIRQKREQSKRNLLVKKDTQATERKKASKVQMDDSDMAEFRRLKLKKANSKRKLLQRKAAASKAA